MKWNVLVFPGGTENGLEILRSLKTCKEVRLFSTSSNQLNHAEYVFKNHSIIPDVRQDGWLEALNTLITTHHIDYIFPANTYVIDALNKVRSQLNCPVVMAKTEVLAITRSKRQTLSLLKDTIPIPEEYTSIESIVNYPVFVKPDNGYGGQNAHIVNTHAVLKHLLLESANLLVQELLPGREYTIDCLSDDKGQLLFCAARLRERIRMGTSMHGDLANNELQAQFSDYANRILQRIPLTGAWFFQMKEDKNKTLKLLEVEARIAGTMALNRVRGVNFPLLSLYLHGGYPVKIATNDYTVTIDRALTNRYKHNLSYEVVYVDLDDTLILYNRLNTELIQFLYQCLGKGIKIVLLSKSLAEDKVGLLKKWRIFEIFDEIHWLSERQSKADYIKDKSAIFIDDSFSQRLEVIHRCGIPSFDGSMIEMLLDEKI